VNAVGSLLGYFWTGMRPKAMKTGLFRGQDAFQTAANFFRLA
jgi:hypothetical protein